MIDVIIPSYNDIRILRTIKSLNCSKNRNILRLIIIDGGSSLLLLELIKNQLNGLDILLSESDSGIFDALNKGLNLASSDYIYWLGSDDFINVEYNFLDIIEQFNKNQKLDCICSTTIFFNKSKATRVFSIRNANLFLYKNGIHLPHFSTIWRRSSIDDIRFDLNYKIASDYDFFFRIFLSKNPTVQADPNILVYMEEGGNSTASFTQRLKGLKEVFLIHKKHTNIFQSFFSILVRYISKFFEILNREKAQSMIVDNLTKLILK